MKYYLTLVLITAFAEMRAQSIAGTWQQMENKTCFESQLPESQTEKELLPGMSSASQTAVAKLIRFDARNRGEEGIFSKGQKKGSSMTAFQYKVTGNELLVLDKKSGIMTHHFVIDELSESTLKIHDAVKDCESRTFSRVK
jgi:hypothetical protein